MGKTTEVAKGTGWRRWVRRAGCESISGGHGLPIKSLTSIVLKYFLPLLSAALLVAAVCLVGLRRERYSLATPLREPPRSPFRNAIAARGTAEPETESIEIASPVAGVVVEVFVQPGKQVEQGDPLFRLDSRHLLAELKIREAALKVANAERDCLEGQPRPEEVPIAQASVRRAESRLADRENQAQRSEVLAASHAVSEQEVFTNRQAVYAAQAELDQAQAELTLLRSGAWAPRRTVCLASVAQAEAAVEQTKTELSRMTICAPTSGEVLRVDMRPGEFLSTPPLRPPMVLGGTRSMHVRVDIDEHDIPRFRPTSPARAMATGDPQRTFSLGFVRVEPIVMPKKVLGGFNHEIVDTRVLQVIYRVDSGYNDRLYVGQQLEVYVRDSSTTPVE